ncbi:MAG: glycerophosphodiester phosphodiesterase [Acidimicrobiales bacterium]
MRFPVLDHPGPLPIAHRGGSGEAQENSVAAFEHARRLGYDYLETDVHLSADGVVVVIHDPVLDRVADRSGRVQELAWSQLRAARLGGTEPIPRLDELLASWPDVRWNIDAKHDAVVGPLVEVLRRAGALDRVCVTAFSDRRIANARRLAGPRLCTSTGPKATTALRVASLAPGVLALGGGPPGAAWGPAGAVQVPLRWGAVPVVDRRLVTTAHRADLAVHVWTIDDEAEMGRLLDLGVDGIMTDRPTLLRQVLEGRNLWRGKSSS